jgi:hypothetical protein
MPVLSTPTNVVGGIPATETSGRGGIVKTIRIIIALTIVLMLNIMRPFVLQKIPWVSAMISQGIWVETAIRIIMVGPFPHNWAVTGGSDGQMQKSSIG